jgi:hypothetical protein
VTFSNSDHVAPEARTVGLWVVPSPGARLGKFARSLRAFGWAPLARSFAPRSRAPRVLEADRAALFGEARGPWLYSDMRFGVTTSPRDAVH